MAGPSALDGDRQHAVVPCDQFAVVGHHAGHGPAELRHVDPNLRHLIGAVDLGIAGIGASRLMRTALSLPTNDLSVIWATISSEFRFAQNPSASSSKRDPEVGKSFELFADVGLQHPLKDRGLDHHRFARCLFHLSRDLRSHQCRYAGRPGDPDIALLPR